LAAAVLAMALPFGCMGRSSLRIGAGEEQVLPSGEFCATSEYESGFRDVSLYMLLDQSSSMLDDGKWAQATAALSAFVRDPAVEGMGFGLQYFPLSSYCDSEQYAIPALPIRPLPDGAADVDTSLAAQQPDGDTPTLPALRGGIEHARAKQLAEPDRAVAVALVTDGWPNACDSSAERLVSLAREGVSTDPPVLTYVIGFRTGRLSILDQIAAAGGTGQAVVIGSDGAAQQLVDTLKQLRERLQECRYAVPPVEAEPVGSDVTVAYLRDPDSEPQPLPFVTGLAACSGDGFYVDDLDAPTEVQLCPASCDRVQAERDSRVVVTVGCGAGQLPSDAGVDGAGDSCGGAVSFQCVPGCGQSPAESPVCEDGLWICPPGTVPTYDCTTCPAVPHRCCQPDGLLAPASCIDGAWRCPPGGMLFGSEGCRPPEVCAAELPCASGQYCRVDDYSCGEDELPGACLEIPASCTGPEEPVCGCNGLTYPSECAAILAAVGLSTRDSCPTPAGRFRCGPRFCRLGDQICRHIHRLGAAPGEEHDYRCIDPPPSCPTGCGCDLCEPCPPDSSCLESCAMGGLGGWELTCTEI
jgi:hypothetical protein